MDWWGFFCKYFIYGTSFYGIFKVNAYINEFIETVTPNFKHKEKTIDAIRIIGFLLLFLLWIKALNKIF